MNAVVALKGPGFKAGLLEQHLDLIFVHPSTIGRVHHGQTSLDAGTGEGDQHFAEGGVHGRDLDDTGLRGGQGVEKRREPFGVLCGADERENSRAFRAVLFVDVGVRPRWSAALAM